MCGERAGSRRHTAYRSTSLLFPFSIAASIVFCPYALFHVCRCIPLFCRLVISFERVSSSEQFLVEKKTLCISYIKVRHTDKKERERKWELWFCDAFSLCPFVIRRGRKIRNATSFHVHIYASSFFFYIVDIANIIGLEYISRHIENSYRWLKWESSI